MKCPRCQQDNPSHASFCLKCGTPLGSTVTPARSYANLQAENEGLLRALSESLDQQTATAEILRVISQAQTDLQPVFDAIAESALRLLGAWSASLFRYDGEFLQMVSRRQSAEFGYARPLPWRSAGAEMLDPALRLYRPTGEWPADRAVLERAVQHFADVETDALAGTKVKEWARAHGWRSLLQVPMMHRGDAIGVIAVTRAQPGGFSPAEITLLQTFADQAVIAIENVRLFKELEAKNTSLTEALDQQTATGEILRVISSSPTDVQPIFDAIVRSASRLCDAAFSAVTRFEGGLLHLVAVNHVTPEETEAYRSLFPRAPGRHFIMGRAFLDGQPVHVEDVLTDPDYDPRRLEVLQSAGVFRTYLGVPIILDGVPIGAIGCGQREMRPFTAAQIELVKTFADQAVIAIENVRLFTELQATNRELRTALDTQTATSDILSVISRSQTDVQPVFDAILASAVRLLGAYSGVLTRIAGDQIVLAALTSSDDAGDAATRALFPQALQSELSTTGQWDKMAAGYALAIREREPVNIADAHRDPRWPEAARAYARLRGYRSWVAVPMLRHDGATGTISVTRREPGGFTDDEIALLQTFADQAVIAIENVRLFTELQASNRELRTALDTQTATSDILRVISQSPTDVQPVFDAIIASAVRLLGGHTCGLTRVTGNQLELIALTSIDAAADGPVRAAFPQSLQAVGAHPWAIRDRVPLNVADAHTDARLAEGERVFAGIRGFRSWVVVPMLRDDVTIGSIGVTRREAGGFTADEIALLKTFAAQAVIAIENVRLFTELQEKNRALTEAHAQVSETLEQQTATSEILRVISSSPTDVQPVFDAIAASATRLCDGVYSVVFRYDGEVITVAADNGRSADTSAVIRSAYPAPPGRRTLAGRALLEGRVIAMTNAQDSRENPDGAERARAMGYRAGLSVPMLRGDVAIGVINVVRVEAIPFTATQIELLRTFADQAVIAIENVRLFKELQTRNRDLTEALDQQTATSEVLKVISRSTFDLQPVLSTLVENAVRLAGATGGALAQFDGQVFRIVAEYGVSPEFSAYWRQNAIHAGHRGAPISRAALERRMVHIVDVLTDPEYDLHDAQRAGGQRSVLSVPMLRKDELVGVFFIYRTEVRAFTDKQIDLVATFADQAVIAIENVRLFKELEARTHDLTRSVGELRALGEVSQAISSTLDLQIVLQTIVARATQLSGMDAGVIYEYDEQGEVFVPRATERLEAEIVETMLATPVRKGEGATGRLAEVHDPIQLPDIVAAPAESRVRGVLVRAGYKALLAVPLVRDDRLLGGLTVFRKTPGDFVPEVVDLLRTFATQSALAIQNARLFREIEQKSRELEAASRHKSEFLANMSHELRTPLNAIIGFSEVLDERMFGELNEKQDEYLKDIHASGQHLLSLINDILDLSKIEAGHMELELTDFHLSTALDNALTLVRERAGRRGIALHMITDERLEYVRADERKIKQVLINLLSNAIKFTPEGGRIEVRAIPVDGSVEVSVSDTGVGIAPEDQEAIFEEFRQVGTANKKVEGTGLGLALSRKFIELHGGRIRVESQVGAGSTFTFTIPMRIGI